jgi:hypothetical protein
MPNTTTSPLMGMPVPVVGTDPGPDWANNLNACLSIIDGHNHTTGEGAPIPFAGLSGFASTTYSPSLQYIHLSGGTATFATNTSTWYYFQINTQVFVMGQVGFTTSAYSGSSGIYVFQATIPVSTTTLTVSGLSIGNGPSGTPTPLSVRAISNAAVADDNAGSINVQANGVGTVTMAFVYGIN